MHQLEQPSRSSVIAGWIGLALSTGLSAFWAFWGSIEAFHEGWFYSSLWRNLGLTLVQYLMPAIVVAIPAVIALFRPRVGAALHLLGLGIGYVVNTAVGRTLILIPLVGLAALYWFAAFPHRKIALYALLGVPFLTAIVCGAEPAWRTLHRIDDGDRGSRVVGSLRWAPAGPGWPLEGAASWHQAHQACEHLSADGVRREDAAPALWRLPAIEELVGSMTRQGQNAGGVWNSATRTPSYARMPEKESPLWDPYSQVVYWWAGTETAADRAWRIHFNGRAMDTRKSVGPKYYGFRCVRSE